MLTVLDLTATAIETDNDGTFRLVYHSTVVFEYNRTENVVVLDFGGYPTVTTRRRMNQAAEMAGVGRFTVYQEKGEQYASVNGEVIELDPDEINIIEL